MQVSKGHKANKWLEQKTKKKKTFFIVIGNVSLDHLNQQLVHKIGTEVLQEGNNR